MITDWRECKVALRAVGIKQVDLATFSLSLSSNDIVKACGIQERGNSLRITRYVKFSVIGVPFYSNRMAKAIKGGWNSQYKYSIGWSAVCKKDSGSPRPPHNSGRQAHARACARCTRRGVPRLELIDCESIGELRRAACWIPTYSRRRLPTQGWQQAVALGSCAPHAAALAVSVARPPSTAAKATARARDAVPYPPVAAAAGGRMVWLFQTVSST